MNTKKCSKCGWEYPIDWPGRSCRFCHEPFEGGPCSHCGRIFDKLHNGVCRECETKQHRAWREGRIENAETSYKNWLKKINSLPYPSPTLTEEQWMEACKHFGGCAYCGDANIDARSMFIRFKEGGRYCAWNVVPSCERCETLRKSIYNPFIRMDQMYRRGNKEPAKKYGFSLDKLQKIVDYLQSKMEEIQNE